MAAGRITLITTAISLAIATFSRATSEVIVLPDERTADMPDSWLVLYNLNCQDSVDWAAWYQQERSIPAENMIGLNASLEEHLLDKAEVQDQIIGPVRDLLDNDPALETKIMGIIIGYGVPGHYDDPYYGGPGGYSVADALEDVYDDYLPPGPMTLPGQQGYNDHDNPQWVGLMLPAGGRITKATMDPHRYMVARIDGPTLADAMALTQRAKAIEDPNHYINTEHVWYDYTDGALPGSTWYWLKYAVQEPDLAEIPWTQFNADTDQTPRDAFRFGTHDVVGWDDDRLYHPDAGSRILAFNYNSWGATTVRSTVNEGARYVPNALAAGYAAAIGSTGEPGCCLGPCPETLLAALREGWTLGESLHISAVFDDWMWTLVGDPFLTIPHWFDDLPPPGDGDMNSDGNVDGTDLPLFVRVLSGEEDDPVLIAKADLTGDGALNDDDTYLFMAPSICNTYDYDVLKGTGDADGDRFLTGKDIGAFVEMLLHGTEGRSLRARWGADMNKDGQITHEDLPLFVDAILQ
ncbi:MAG: hypothetical protein JXQ75_19270 [Phycisphaerae bacterium]|nr:hypothetical protein [Phycisphaerae bacterium]